MISGWIEVFLADKGYGAGIIRDEIAKSNIEAHRHLADTHGESPAR